MECIVNGEVTARCVVVVGSRASLVEAQPSQPLVALSSAEGESMEIDDPYERLKEIGLEYGYGLNYCARFPTGKRHHIMG